MNQTTPLTQEPVPRETPPRVAVVLAAGQGTRMRSSLPKVLHRAGGRPLLAWVIDAARAAGCERILVVIGHGAEAVQAELAAPDLSWVLQAEQKGTGHALAQTAPQISGEATLLVLSGDAPLVRAETIAALAFAGERSPGGALAVADLSDPAALGRVFTTPDGGLDRIVEARDASPEELRQTTINAGLYALKAPAIFEDLARIGTDNAQGELYLTDAVTLAAREGRQVTCFPLEDPAEAWGVNNRRELALVHRRLLERHLDALMISGVTILEPARTSIEPSVSVEPDAQIHADVTLLGQTSIGRGTTIHQGSWLRDCHVAEGVEILPYCVLEGARISAGSRIGPFARLRPGSSIGEGARIGNFVEVKNSEIGPNARANHLAYLGDATVGAGANVGAGVVTCNYDGVSKHRTEIGAGAFVGSDTMLVAPVEVGAGAQTAAGSIITKNVPDGALGVGRLRQRNILGAVERLRARRPPKEASTSGDSERKS